MLHWFCVCSNIVASESLVNFSQYLMQLSNETNVYPNP